VLKFNGGLSQLHSADDAATAWLTNYGSLSHTQEEEERSVKVRLFDCLHICSITQK